jgi:hypothetical protein
MDGRRPMEMRLCTYKTTTRFAGTRRGLGRQGQRGRAGASEMISNYSAGPDGRSVDLSIFPLCLQPGGSKD